MCCLSVSRSASRCSRDSVESFSLFRLAGDVDVAWCVWVSSVGGAILAAACAPARRAALTGGVGRTEPGARDLRSVGTSMSSDS